MKFLLGKIATSSPANIQRRNKVPVVISLAGKLLCALFFVTVED
jgi:hypothetical protein